MGTNSFLDLLVDSCVEPCFVGIQVFWNGTRQGQPQHKVRALQLHVARYLHDGKVSIIIKIYSILWACTLRRKRGTCEGEGNSALEGVYSHARPLAHVCAVGEGFGDDAGQSGTVPVAFYGGQPYITMLDSTLSCVVTDLQVTAEIRTLHDRTAAC